ncbi:BZ3500_MvSof-1268-A1-R1_Chr5-1g07602 [Microbotryum saponariae]|uniref:BZ3500_MvSof-1268-A1-R1_Chr5-1g07602 protein n=1 Tax=Microbotryum saponariae TaxID=289078 RepID=A0A2X0KZ64_9BASI|nr:BZ3500_MvSof-1268-A1-R1_Chr5-1g07602 [Microbotryum saponariae]SDA05473.1 BZ3501_MvSof-1269-A2-R1_Chr5-2g07426 [Microbotryum saponariae]
MGKKDRPTARRTTAITPRSTSASDVLTRFSPSPSSSPSSSSSSASSSSSSTYYYAHLHRAPDTHTLRVYDASSGKCISRWASDAHSLGRAGEEGAEQGETEEQQARHKVHAIEWAWVPSAKGEKEKNVEAAEEEGQGDKKRGKKRRKSDSHLETLVAAAPVAAVDAPGPKSVLVLGQESGEILVWSPNGKEEWTLSHPSVNSPVTALASPATSTGHLWSTHQDGIARVWDLTTRSLIARTTVLGDEVTAWDDLAVRYASPSSEENKIPVHLVLSKASLHIYSLSLGTKAPKKDKVKELKSTLVGRCTGHVDVARVEWVQHKVDESAMEEDSAAEKDDLAFFTYSKTDRFVQLWSFSLSSPTKDAQLVARLGLDSGVQAIASNVAHLVAIDAEGKGYLTSLPSSTTSSKKVEALKVETEVQGATLANAALRSDKLVLCRDGVKPIFEQVEYLSEAGSLVEKIALEKNAAGLFANGQEESAPPSRYVEHPSSNSRSAEPNLATEGGEDDDDLAHSGQLDVDMAEPTLADRLQAMNVSKAKQSKDALAIREDDEEVSSGEDEGLSSDEDEDEDDDEDEEDLSNRLAAPATTLTTTLIQALHSSDAPLLESCLLHDSPTLIRSTVQKLSSGSLVLNLLEALVQRLGTGKGGKVGGTASVQRSRGLIEWVKQVLVVHVGFLVTIPSLVTRLSALHASLTSRLSIQPTLFALNGRLDLVLAQIQSRQQGVIKRRVAAKGGKVGAQGTRYVEGESSEDSEDGEGSEPSEDEGSVEDVMLGGDDEEDDDDDSGEGSEEEDEELGSAEEGSGGGEEGVEGLLELEASEDDEEDDDEENDDDEDEDESD